MRRWNIRIPAPFETWVGSRQLEVALAANGGRVVNALRRVPWVSVELPAGLDPSSLPGVLEAQPDQPLQPLDFHQATMNFTEDFSWPALAVVADMIHQSTRGQGIKIAVLDSGFFPHLEFNGADIRTVESVREQNATDNFGHGTAVLSMLASQDRILGVAPRATYHIIKVYDPPLWGSDFDLAVGIELAMGHGVNVINMSLGLPAGFSLVVDQALSNFAAGGGLAVAGTGNFGETMNQIFHLASSRFCLAVGAHGKDGAVSSFSSWGPWPDSPVCIAPGHQIVAAFNNGSYIQASGTSLASPVAAGCLALSLAARGDRWNVKGTLLDPKYGVALPARVAKARTLLRDLSEPASASRDRTGYGLISAANLAEARTGQPALDLKVLVVALIGGALVLAVSGSGKGRR